MARYIDADELEKHFKVNVSKHILTISDNDYPVFLTDHTLHEIRNAPTADVVEVKKAKWIYETRYYSCSVCGGKRFNLLLGMDAEYCPYCGAKMIFEKEGADNG